MVSMKVPSPGESITEVQIARWLKKDGDYVEKDEELCEIDSDKATLTLSAEASGILSIKVKEGETIAVGKEVCTIDESAVPEAPAGRDSKAAAASSSTEKKEPPQEQKPDADGERVVKAEPRKVPAAESVKAPAQARPKEIQPEEAAAGYATGHASPAAAKMMREKELSPGSVDGSGKGGRITKTDVMRTDEAKGTSANGSQRNVRREKMSMLRKKLAQRLVAVKQETAMLTTFNEVDMSVILALRKQFKDKFKETHGVGLGFMSFFTKAVCEALKNFPTINAQIDGDEIVYHDYCDIGIAVSAPKGLMVPVIRNAETLSLAEIEKQVMELAGKARESKISIDEMTGGTFTITNGGVFGSMLSTPIINPPQSAILGMHNIVERPVAVQGKVDIRPVMYVALSYDHRIIDGRESVSFLVNVKQMLEEPVKMLFGGGDPAKKLLGL